MIPYLGSFRISAATSTIYMTLSISSLPSKHLYNICTAPAQRLWRWSNIVQMNANVLFLLFLSLVFVIIMVMILVYNLTKLSVMVVFRLSSLFCHWLQLSIHQVPTTVNRTFCDSTHETINDEFHVKGNRKKSSCYCRVCWRREHNTPICSSSCGCFWITLNAFFLEVMYMNGGIMWRYGNLGDGS